jgi:hypothetical protein
MKIVTEYMIRYLIPKGAISPTITPNCAEQGIVKPNKTVAIILSLFEPNSLVVIVAIVMQPNPSIIGIIALPLSPTPVSALSTRVAILGKYPESSSMDNKK